MRRVDNERPGPPISFPRPRTPSIVLLVAILSAALFAFAPNLAGAETAETDGSDATTTEADPAAEAEAAILRQGAEVYSQVCSSCHQPGGVGLPGQFPPLIDNPNLDDAEYILDVINNGREGEIVVNGETYNGVMPPFSTLSDDDKLAVIAYIQNDFVAPAAGGDEAAAPLGPTAGTELPPLTNMTAILAYLLALSMAGLVLAPRLISQNSRLNTPWLDVGLKTTAIVLATYFLTMVIPDWALKTSAVSKLSRFAQEFIGTTLWAGGFVLLLWGLWYAHRDSRI